MSRDGAAKARVGWNPARRLAFLLTVFLITPSILRAEPADSLRRSSGPGFLFRTPILTFAFHAGLNQPRANSEIYSTTTDLLTLDKSDFRAPTIGGAVGIRLTSRLDLVLGADYMRSDKRSEYRDWVDQDDLPIEQSTRLTRIPLTGSLKFYLTPPGRQIGQFAWIPSRVAPFVGAGAGFTRYRFEQQGDFVDFLTEDLTIFSTTVIDEGWASTYQVFGGTDVAMGARFALTGQIRYSWASSRMGFTFEDFDNIDLSGVQATVGVLVRL